MRRHSTIDNKRRPRVHDLNQRYLRLVRALSDLVADHAQLLEEKAERDEDEVHDEDTDEENESDDDEEEEEGVHDEETDVAESAPDNMRGVLKRACRKTPRNCSLTLY